MIDVGNAVWQFGFNQPSPIDAVLDKEGVTLDEILAEEELIQECKAINPKLVDFLKQPDVVGTLLGYLTTEVADDAGDEVKYKLPYLAYEIFSCELTEIIDVVFDSPGLFASFMEFINKDDELDTLLVGYFCKILVVLMRKRPERSEDYFSENPDVIDKLLRHSTSLCVADFFTNLLGAGMQVEAPLLPTEFLLEQKVIARLVDQIAPPAGPDARSSAATILKGLLQNGSYNDFPDAPTAPLIEQLTSAECTDKLVEFCTSESEPTRVHAMSVLTALLEMMREERMERQEDGDSTPEVLQKLAGKGGEFAEALQKPPSVGACVLTFGEMRETLGSARLGLIHFLAAMLRSGSAEVAGMFVSSSLAQPIVALFFALPFNNLLHNLVLQIVRTSVHEVASPENFDLVRSILVEGKLCENIVSAFDGYDLKKDDVFQRAGYFGQLHLLAAELSESDAESVTAAVAALEGDVAAGWADLSKEGGVLSTLKEVNEQPIGGGRTGFSLESESSNDELGIGGFGTQGDANDNADKNNNAEGGSGINGEFDAGEKEEMEDAFAALSASGDGGGGDLINDGSEGGGGEAAGGKVDASFSALRPDDDDDDADGWANFGDAADGSTGGDAFAAFEADPPLQPAPAPVPLVDGSASDGGSEINGTATAAAGADFEAAFEANFDDVESNELPAPPATDEKNDAEKEG